MNFNEVYIRELLITRSIEDNDESSFDWLLDSSISSLNKNSLIYFMSLAVIHPRPYFLRKVLTVCDDDGSALSWDISENGITSIQILNSSALHKTLTKEIHKSNSMTKKKM